MNFSSIKQKIAYVCYHTGITNSLLKFQNIAHFGRDNTYGVLNYHRVNDYNDPFTIDSMPAMDFHNQMKYLSRHYNVLSLEDIFTCIENEGILPDHCIAITFDDGYEDNYTCGYKILKKYNLPATIFLTVDCINSKTPLWFDQILSGFKVTKASCFVNPVDNAEHMIRSKEQRLKTAHLVLQALKKVDSRKRDLFISDILNELEVKITDNLENQSMFLSWGMIKEMSKNKISFGSHTMTHPILANQNTSQIEWELANSKKQIENMLMKEAPFFAYPNGQPGDFDQNVIKILKKTGYKGALTTISKRNSASTDPFLLGRFRPWQNAVEPYSMSLLLKELSIQ